MENRKQEDLGITIYSPDGLGFGHLQHVCSIAWKIYRARSEVSILPFFDGRDVERDYA